MYRKIKDIRTNINHMFKLPNLCNNQLIWGELSNSWILNDIGRNSLLGNRRKIAKFLMSTFTYRSTFLYAWSPNKLWRCTSIFNLCSTHSYSRNGGSQDARNNRVPLRTLEYRRGFSVPAVVAAHIEFESFFASKWCVENREKILEINFGNYRCSKMRTISLLT